jgi:hypothetical protein
VGFNKIASGAITAADMSATTNHQRARGKRFRPDIAYQANSPAAINAIVVQSDQGMYGSNVIDLIL